jgi:DNA-binding GntR family transcriptional regulator
MDANTNIEAKNTRWKRQLKRSSLHDEVVSEVRLMILEGELPPGSRVPELELCEHFGVSRTPLREALKVLASEGLIKLLPNRGSLVSEVRADEIEAIFELMEAMERLAGQLIVSRVTDEEIAELEARHQEMLKHYRNVDRPRYFRTNQEIHNHIVRLSGNPILAENYESFSRKIMRARSLANLVKLRWDESVEEHEGIMEALRRRDSTVLADLMAEHCVRTGRVVVTLLHAREENQTGDQRTP